MKKTRDIIEEFSQKKILVIGDTIVDIYVYGTVIGTSAETPTIVAKELEEKTTLGGSFLVVRNLLELGSKVNFVTLVGDDRETERIEVYVHPNLDKILIRDEGRKTTVKKRYWIDQYKLLQLDNIDNRDIGTSIVKKTMSAVEEYIDECDAVLISDYRHGFLTPPLIRSLITLCIEREKIVYADSQISQANANHSLYRGINVITLNTKEAMAFDADFNEKKKTFSFEKIRKVLGIENIIVKIGADGAVGHFNGTTWISNALEAKTVDTCGAGDAFIAAFCLAGLSDPEFSLKVANYWAGLSTEIYGTKPPLKYDLLRLFHKEKPI